MNIIWKKIDKSRACFNFVSFFYFLYFFGGGHDWMSTGIHFLFRSSQQRHGGCHAAHSPSSFICMRDSSTLLFSQQREVGNRLDGSIVAENTASTGGLLIIPKGKRGGKHVNRAVGEEEPTWFYFSASSWEFTACWEWERLMTAVRSTFYKSKTSPAHPSWTAGQFHCFSLGSMVAGNQPTSIRGFC